jgi:hypothetical protein
MEPHCKRANCPEKCVPKKFSIPLSYLTAALALSVPVIKSAGADVKATLALTSLDFSFMTLILLAVWLISGFVAGMEKHQSYVLCIIHSLGIPGLVLALLTIGQL